MNLTEDPRASGEIRRYHTWAVHNQQSVGEHSWQILRIILTVWPSAPRHILIYTVKHDMGEMAGDIPYPFKIMIGELRPAMQKAENIVEKLQNERIGVPQLKHPLSQFERHVFKACENIEMWEHGWREYNMGNKYAITIIDRMMNAVSANLIDLEGMRDTKEYRDHESLIPAIHRYMKTRTQMETEYGTTRT
jgi:5'-deoxynucleotidase YfbR-like HD superfamily hydrolase